MGVSDIIQEITFVSKNNVIKITNDTDITTYTYTYNTEGKPITKKTYENGGLVSTSTYFYG
jgi:hypothetical protein